MFIKEVCIVYSSRLYHGWSLESPQLTFVLAATFLKVNNHIPLPNFTWVKTLDTFYGCYKYTFTVMIHDVFLDVRTRSYVNLHTATLLLDVLHHKKVNALYNMDFMRGITLYARFIQPWIEIIWFPIAIIWHLYSLKPPTFWTPIGRYDP